MLVVSLVGEQPIPSLLPVRYLQPEALLLVYTFLTKDVARRVGGLVNTEVACVKVDPYDTICIGKALRREIGGRVDLLFNLTGGTKPMMLAAYSLAAETNSPVVYLQSEERQSLLYRYHFVQGQLQLEKKSLLPTLLNIDDYLRAHLPHYCEAGYSKDDKGRISEGGLFEQAVCQALVHHVDEVKVGVQPKGVANQIEIDLVVRCGNQVGIIEAKTGANKAGIDQLATAGGARYLGTYTRRFLVVGRRLRHELKVLARARDIIVVELPDYEQGQPFRQADADRLRRTIRTELAGRGAAR